MKEPQNAHQVATFCDNKIEHMHSLPVVFVIDWDGTIAGKVDFQSQAYSLAQVLRKNGFKPKPLPSVIQSFSPKSKLIRPGFVSFINAMQRFYQQQGVYFFIYTASEKAWAHYEIALMEKQCGIKFMRPIFTRDDCTVDQGGQYRKSIGRIFPRICRAISKTKPLTSPERMHLFENNLILIDNNAVYTDRPDKLLLCPDYDYAVFENLMDMIPEDARDHPIISQTILSLVNSGHLCPAPQNNSVDVMKDLTNTYSWLAARCKSLQTANRIYEQDDFWKHLRKLIMQNGLYKFTPSIVRQLQEATWKRLKHKKV